MAVMPGVAYHPISYKNVPKMTRYDVVCLHTIVGHDPAPAAHFSVGAHGEQTQSRDTTYQSAANYQGNPRVIAIETEDWGPPFPDWGGDPKKVPPWTVDQMESIAKILVWIYQTYGVPLVPCPDSKSTSRGIAYHRQGISGNFTQDGYGYPGVVPGGELWSTSTGKSCPGDARITQLLTIVIPRARVLAGLEQPEEDMAGFATVELPPSDRDEAGELQVKSTTIALPWSPSTGTGVTRVWVTLFTSNSPMTINVAHYRVLNADNQSTSVVWFVPDATVVQPLSIAQRISEQAPDRAVALVIDHVSALGGTVSVEYA